MTKQELEKELLHFLDLIKEEQKRQPADNKRVPLMAMVIAEKDGKEVKALMPIPDSEHRFKIMEIAGKKAHEMFDKVHAILAISECWYSKQDKKDFKKNGYIPPSQDPNRQEAMLVSGMNANKEVVCIMYAIDKNGLIGEPIKEFMGEKADKFESPLLEGFWPSDSTMPKVQSHAKFYA